MSDIPLAAFVLAAVAPVVCWQIRRALRGDDYRTYNDKRAAWLAVCDGPRPEPPAPGSNEQWLATCREIYAADTDIREEKP
jgi:hypothetical protein